MVEAKMRDNDEKDRDSAHPVQCGDIGRAPPRGEAGWTCSAAPLNLEAYRGWIIPPLRRPPQEAFSEWPRPNATSPRTLQPRPGDYRFDLEASLRSVVGLRADNPRRRVHRLPRWAPSAPATASSSPAGWVLTMGYLIMESESIWLTTADWLGGAGPCAGGRCGNRLWVGAAARQARRGRDGDW